MRTVTVGLGVLLLLAAVGCQPPAGPSTSEKQFQKLYKEYSNLFHEKMVSSAEQTPPIQITAEAARIWDRVFAGREDLIRTRQREILDDLDAAPTLDEDLYLEVAQAARVESDEQPKGIVLKQFLWSPPGAAQFFLNNWLARRMNRGSYNVRSVLTANASLFWEVARRDADNPLLVQREGPMVFTVELTRQGDYYFLQKVRWLRSKSLGPIVQQAPPPPETGPGDVTPTPSPPAPAPPAPEPAPAPAPEPAPRG
jgi:hypothetical protein